MGVEESMDTIPGLSAMGVEESMDATSGPSAGCVEVSVDAATVLSYTPLQVMATSALDSVQCTYAQPTQQAVLRSDVIPSVLSSSMLHELPGSGVLGVTADDVLIISVPDDGLNDDVEEGHFDSPVVSGGPAVRQWSAFNWDTSNDTMVPCLRGTRIRAEGGGASGIRS